MSQYFENDEKIKSDLRLLNTVICGKRFQFYSDNGVFSKNEIDYGSKLLIETFIKNDKSGKFLDVGSGVGVISIVLCKILNCFCDMVEINDRAIELSKRNVKLNGLTDKIEVIKSDVYENISGKYDVIITNPPIRAGKKVIYKILFEAFNHLNDNGELWFVMRKNHGVLSTMKDLKENAFKCDVVGKDKGFFIIKVSR